MLLAPVIVDDCLVEDQRAALGYPCADTETRGIDLAYGDAPRPNRPMGVKALARPHRWGVLLPVAYRHVVAQGVAGDERNCGAGSSEASCSVPLRPRLLRQHRLQFHDSAEGGVVYATAAKDADVSVESVG